MINSKYLLLVFLITVVLTPAPTEAQGALNLISGLASERTEQSGISETGDIIPDLYNNILSLLGDQQQQQQHCGPGQRRGQSGECHPAAAAAGGRRRTEQSGISGSGHITPDLYNNIFKLLGGQQQHCGWGQCRARSGQCCYHYVQRNGHKKCPSYC